VAWFVADRTVRSTSNTYRLKRECKELYRRVEEARKGSELSTLVRIHEAWHGAWCWDRVAPLLEHAGHEVVRFDLPGHGEDRTPAAKVTLEGYTGRIVEALALPCRQCAR
jgi:pimeloyl-ACP methyl ester carboxylesterase